LEKRRGGGRPQRPAATTGHPAREGDCEQIRAGNPAAARRMIDPALRPKKIVPPEIIRVGQIEIRFLIESKDTSGQFAMFEFTVPAGAKVPMPHSHTHYDETIYGLEGVMTFTVNGQPVDIAADDTCFIPRGAVHGFNNLKSASAKALAVVTPALIGPDFFREMAAIFNVNAGGPPDVEKLKAVMNKHGLVPAPPQK
jgi:quercetin dioxygenase-like cupin family protein